VSPPRPQSTSFMEMGVVIKRGGVSVLLVSVVVDVSVGWEELRVWEGGRTQSLARLE